MRAGSVDLKRLNPSQAKYSLSLALLKIIIPRSVYASKEVYGVVFSAYFRHRSF